MTMLPPQHCFILFSAVSDVWLCTLEKVQVNTECIYFQFNLFSFVDQCSSILVYFVKFELVQALTTVFDHE